MDRTSPRRFSWGLGQDLQFGAGTERLLPIVATGRCAGDPHGDGLFGLLQPLRKCQTPPQSLRIGGRRGRIADRRGHGPPGLVVQNVATNKTETAKQQATGPRGNSPFFGPPAAPPGPFYRNPFMGLEQTSNVIVMTPLGEIRSLDGTSQLPYLLGNLSLLPLEQLSEGNEPVWQLNRGAAISEADDQLGEPAFSPFARPKSEKTTAASASESFRIEPSPGNLVVIAKTFQMKSPGAEESLEINGSGKWTFNRGWAFPKSSTSSRNWW